MLTCVIPTDVTHIEGHCQWADVVFFRSRTIENEKVAVEYGRGFHVAIRKEIQVFNQQWRCWRRLTCLSANPPPKKMRACLCVFGRCRVIYVCVCVGVCAVRRETHHTFVSDVLYLRGMG